MDFAPLLYSNAHLRAIAIAKPRYVIFLANRPLSPDIETGESNEVELREKQDSRVQRDMI